MGNTKFQRFIFTLMMCFMMVLFMTAYNMLLAGAAGEGRFLANLFRDFWLGFAIALFLDVFVVSKIAKPVAMGIIGKKEISHMFMVVLVISTSMVTGMVLCMSAYGSIVTAGFTGDAVRVYPRIVLFNFIAAWPLNLLIVNPAVRFLHMQIFPPEQKEAQAA